MSLKYAKRSQVIWFAILAAIKACNILFVAYMIKIMLNVASSHSKDVMHLVRLAALTALGQLCFMMSNFIYERVKMGSFVMLIWFSSRLIYNIWLTKVNQI